MLKAIIALIVIGVMFFGGAGATVFAAQDALPNDALYPLKTATEDLRLAFALDSQSELDLLLNYTDRRMDEVLALSEAGEAVPEDVVLRLNAEMELVEDIITELDEPELSEATEKVQVLIRDRDRDSWADENVCIDPLYDSTDPNAVCDEYETDDMLRLLATRAWTLEAVDSDVCIDPKEEVCTAYYKVCTDPAGIYDPTDPLFLIYDPTADLVTPISEEGCKTILEKWVFDQPDPQFRFRNPDANSYGAAVQDPNTETDSNMRNMGEVPLDGNGQDQGQGQGGQGQGTSMSPNDNASGPGQEQGNAADHAGGESQKDDGSSKVGGSDSQVGPSQYYNYNYPFLEFFNLPTPKANKTGGGSGKK